MQQSQHQQKPPVTVLLAPKRLRQSDTTGTIADPNSSARRFLKKLALPPNKKFVYNLCGRTMRPTACARCHMPCPAAGRKGLIIKTDGRFATPVNTTLSKI
jgi:hypothetical protein